MGSLVRERSVSQDHFGPLSSVIEFLARTIHTATAASFRLISPILVLTTMVLLLAALGRAGWHASGILGKVVILLLAYTVFMTVLIG